MNDCEITPLRRAELEASARLRKKIKSPDKKKYGANFKRRESNKYKYLFKSDQPELSHMALAGLAVKMFHTRHELNDVKHMRES